MPAKQYQKKIKELEEECSKLAHKMIENFNEEDNDKIKELAEHILALDPENAKGNNFLGEYYHNIDEYDDAISAYDLAISLDKTYAWSYFNKACSMYYVNDSKTNEEIKNWARAGIFLDPNLLKDGGIWIEDLFDKEDIELLKEDIADYKKNNTKQEIIALEGMIDIILSNYPEADSKTINWVALEDICLSILEIDNKNIVALWNMGLIAAEDIGNYKLAAKYFRDCLSIDKNDNEAKFELVKTLYWHAKDTSNCIDDMKKSSAFKEAKANMEKILSINDSELKFIHNECECEECNNEGHNWINTFFTAEEQAKLLNKKKSSSSFAVPAMLGAAAIIGSAITSTKSNEKRDASSN